MTAAVLDHLWQSTILALALGLTTLAFRRAPAAVRHGLWFAASAKFLIPLAALAALGRRLAPAIRLPRPAAPEVGFMERTVEPFSQPVLAQGPLSGVPIVHGPDLPAALPQTPLPQTPLPQTPLPHVDAAVAAVHAASRLDIGLALLTVWALGSAAMLILWARRWARLRRVVRAARPVGWAAPMPVLAAPALVEPGLVGLWRPVLLVPETLPGALPRSGVDAIVAHEAAHLRRRDNLTAALHMLVEALFWFHPLVWWIGGRLIAERERACDEAVLAEGHDRTIYARSLVESCRLYLQSPLDCVAGASGSDLKSRVQAIMTARPAIPLSRAGKAVLLAAGACAFATPVMAGLLTTPEGKTVVARAEAAASRAAPALVAPPPSAAPVSAPAEGQPARSVVLAKNESLVAPSLSVAQLDLAATPLAQDASAPRVDHVDAPAPAVPPPATLTPVASPAQAPSEVSAFVRSYGEAFWNQDKWICVRVEGLPSDQAAAVKARVEADARAVGVSVGRAECGLRNEVEIRFATDADRAVESVLAYYHHPVWPFPLERPAGADRPIRAWYGMVWDFAGGAGGRGLGAHPNARQKLNLAIVVVDPARTRGLSLDTVSDYAAMLALSQPRSLDRCNVLPSITDLYAGACAGRPAQAGLTAADTAFLTALYRGSPGLRATRSFSELVEGVAKRLGGSGTVRPAAAAPPAPPRLPLTPIALTAQPATAKQEVSAFVQSFANTLWNGEDSICIRVEGGDPAKAAQLQARVASDARAAGVSVSRDVCQTYQVEIRFASDAERAVRDVLADRRQPSWPRPLERPHGSRPIQAWYEVVDDLTHAIHPSQWAPGPQTGMEAQIVEAAPYGHSRLGLAIVVVDPARTRDLSLDTVADYAALLALSQPRALDRCNVLPSVADLFAGACPGRPAPAGLTAADMAYLEALYAGNPELRAARYRSDLVDGMARRLAPERVAAR